MGILQFEPELGGQSARAAPTITTLMRNGEIPFGGRAAMEDRNKMVEGQTIETHLLATDMASHVIPTDDRGEIHLLDASTFSECPTVRGLPLLPEEISLPVGILPSPSGCEPFSGPGPLPLGYQGCMGEVVSPCALLAARVDTVGLSPAKAEAIDRQLTIADQAQPHPGPKKCGALYAHPLIDRQASDLAPPLSPLSRLRCETSPAFRPATIARGSVKPEVVQRFLSTALRAASNMILHGKLTPSRAAPRAATNSAEASVRPFYQAVP